MPSPFLLSDACDPVPSPVTGRILRPEGDVVEQDRLADAGQRIAMDAEARLRVEACSDSLPALDLPTDRRLCGGQPHAPRGGMTLRRDSG